MTTVIGLSELIIRPTHTLREVMTILDRTAQGIVFLTDEDGRLLRTITDGDIRRALLSGRDIEDPIFEIGVTGSHTGGREHPLTAPAATPPERLLQLMQGAGVRHIPLVDDSGRLVGLRTLSDLAVPARRRVDAVVMAGGFGRRLLPLTENLPKPMLPVGDRPVMEHILERLRRSGFTTVHVTTHFEPEKITSYFGDGSRFGISIDYVHESEPLGTAGALGLLRDRDHPLLVVNGDVLTEVDFDAMLAFHEDSGAELTVGVRRFEMAVPYGVVDIQGDRVRALAEKPTYRFFVNAGVYIVEPRVFDCIDSGSRLDATDLIDRLIAQDRPVAGFPIHEYWLDIGRHDDYARAGEEWPVRRHTVA